MDFQTVTNRQKVALIACPLASRNTIPLALPAIAAFVEQHGYPVTCWDLNLEFQEILHERGVPADFWNVMDWYALTPARESILEELADEWAAVILRDAPTVVGFSVTAVSTAVTLMVAKAVKRLAPAVKTVFGGPECIVSWPYFIAKKAVDFVVVGEGEQPFVELLQALDQGRERIDIPAVVTKQSNGAAPQNAVNRDLDALPYPAFSKMALARYARNGRLELPILGSVGCVQNCTFCSRHYLHGGFRCKSPQRIIDELQHNIATYGARDFLFVDSLINGKIKQLTGWTTAVIEQGLDIRWHANAILSPKNTAELLQTLRAAGCMRLWYGLESGSSLVLKDMRKLADVARIEQNLRDTHAAGIYVTCYMFVGYPTETEVDFQASLAFLERNHASIDSILPSICYIGEGTTLDEKQAAYGLVGGRVDWQNENSTPELRAARYAQLVAVAEDLGIVVHRRGLVDFLPMPKAQVTP